MNLKDYLIRNNIQKYTDFDKDEYLDEYKNLVSGPLFTEFKYKENHRANIEYIKRDFNLLCDCGSGIDVSWWSNGSTFFSRCAKCRSKHINHSEMVRKSRSNEFVYDGELLSEDDTTNELNNIDLKKYLGSGKQRTFIKDHRQLYFSVMHHTKKLDDTKCVNLRARIQYLTERPNIHCQCGAQSKFDNQSTFQFLKYCSKCKPRYPTKEWFIEKHGDNYEEEFQKDLQVRKERYKGNMSLDWFIRKYGERGEEEHSKHYQKIMDSRSNESFSKISQKLFWSLEKELSDKENIFFAECNREKHINLNKEDKDILGDRTRVRINLDFVYKNKVIEFNGNYWHSSQTNRANDIARRKICERKGYDVLFVWEEEFKSNPDAVKDRCLRFLRAPSNVRFNDRYMIETTNGFESFDNIVSRGKKQTIKIITENEEIQVSENHVFRVKELDILANELKIGDYLETKMGLEYITGIEKQQEAEVFDVLHTNSNTFLANNINNHNCSFLGSSNTLISSDKLRIMEPKECEELRDGKLKIYNYPEDGHQYIMTVDAAKDGTDNFAVQVVDITDFHFRQVASAQLQIDYLLMPEFIAEWAEFYNNPYLIIENNEGAGQSIADQMKNDYEYENLHYDKDVGQNRRKKYPGFRTTTKTRKQILQTLKLFIENDKLNVVDHPTIQEFFQFILVNNKYQADEGAHDDMIMSLALTFVPFVNSKNFESMKLLVKNLYQDAELSDKEKINFGELMTIGSFDDGTDEEYFQEKQEYTSMEEAMADMEGFY